MSLIFTVKNTKDSGPNSLRQAIRRASFTPGSDTIVFDAKVFDRAQTIRLRSTLVINTSLTLLGSGAARLSLSGDRDGSRTNNRGDVPVLRIQSGTVKITGLTLTGGRAQGQNGAPGDGGGGGAAGMGGGLFINDGNVTLQNVVLRNNRAIGGNGGKSLGLNFSNQGGKGGDSTLGAGGTGGAILSVLPPTGLDGFFGAGGGGAGHTAAFGIPFFYYGMGGKGGFGGGGGSPTQGVKYYGPLLGGIAGIHGAVGSYASGGSGAGLGGAIFIRTGRLTLKNTQLLHNSASGGNSADGKGGGIYMLKTLSNENSSGLDPTHPNNQGMPTALPKVFSWKTTFSHNSATQSQGHTTANGIGKNQDNADVYGSLFPLPSPPDPAAHRAAAHRAAAHRSLGV